MKKDFEKLNSKISLHGLGFIQVNYESGLRMHVWHPDLPRRKNFEESQIHNHRFAFESTVLVGKQVNQRYTVVPIDDRQAPYDLISHDGKRTELGNRMSFVESGALVYSNGSIETYSPGQKYTMAALEYHSTPNSGVVVTLMKKTRETNIHAHSLIKKGFEFDQSFDRFQMSEKEMWAIVHDALKEF